MNAVLPPKKVRAEIDSLLRADLADRELRERLEQLASNPSFGGFTWLWGPRLYRRNRVLFRPFILSHFQNILIKPNWQWERVDWKGEIGRKLDEWLAEVEAVGDSQLFKKLYPWKHASGSWGSVDENQWRTDLITRLQAAPTPAARATVLEMFDIWVRLDEPTAIAIYELDPPFAGPFILKHLGAHWGESRKLWWKLFELARRQGDDPFAFQLYRRQIDVSHWEKEVLKLANVIRSSAELNAELERRHPEGWNLPLGMTICRLVEKRGRDVLPYVQKHLRTVYRSWSGTRDGYAKLVKLAADRNWWDLWSNLVRTCSHPEEFNTEVLRLLKDGSLSERNSRERLLMLSGVSREWNMGPFSLAQVQQLEDSTAVLLYRRFPELPRGPFRMNIAAGWSHHLPKLTDAALAAQDETLIDYLASRMVTRADWGWDSGHIQTAEKLSRHYEQFRDDDAEFSRRAVNSLQQVPAHSLWSYGRLIQTNRLARLFYERSAAKYLAHPVGVRDLLECGEIHAQALAFRILGLPRDEARQLGRQNLDLLLATLLRPLHRKTRSLAFQALENAALDPSTAQTIHRKCREALDLPDKRYPKEQLVGFIGRLIHRWPELQKMDERPLIYGEFA